jgi:hypothetical protein
LFSPRERLFCSGELPAPSQHVPQVAGAHRLAALICTPVRRLRARRITSLDQESVIDRSATMTALVGPAIGLLRLRAITAVL